MLQTQINKTLTTDDLKKKKGRIKKWADNCHAGADMAAQK